MSSRPCAGCSPTAFGAARCTPRRWSSRTSPSAPPSTCPSAWSAARPPPGEALEAEVAEAIGDGVLLHPPFARVAPRHGATVGRPWILGPMAAFNLLGLPATEVPLGLNERGLPLGVQVAAAAGQDHLTIAVAIELERAFGGWVPPAVRRRRRCEGRCQVGEAGGGTRPIPRESEAVFASLDVLSTVSVRNASSEGRSEAEPPTPYLTASCSAAAQGRRPYSTVSSPSMPWSRVVADRAVHLVGAGRQVELERLAVAGLQVGGDLLDPVALDLEVVDRLAVVDDVDRDRAGGRRRGIGVERELGLADRDRLAATARVGAGRRLLGGRLLARRGRSPRRRRRRRRGRAGSRAGLR